MASFASGIFCFFGGAAATLSVAFATYALASDWISGVAVYALPVVWTVAVTIILKRIGSRDRSLELPAVLLVIAGPIVGFFGNGAIARIRANLILDRDRETAEVLFHKELPFAFPPGCQVRAGELWGRSDARLSVITQGSPARVLEYFRETLPPGWRQYRAWQTQHVFVSPGSSNLEYSVTVDLADQQETRFWLLKTEGSKVLPEDRSKLRQLREPGGKYTP